MKAQGTLPFLIAHDLQRHDDLTTRLQSSQKRMVGSAPELELATRSELVG